MLQTIASASLAHVPCLYIVPTISLEATSLLMQVADDRLWHASYRVWQMLLFGWASTRIPMYYPHDLEWSQTTSIPADLSVAF